MAVSTSLQPRQFKPNRCLALLLLLGGVVASPSAFACGGGGSGAYRKPLRPDQFHQVNARGQNQGLTQPPSSADAAAASHH